SVGYYYVGDLRDLHSFPTRRSSDLGSISKTCKYNHRNTWWNNDTDSRRCCGNSNCCFFIITFTEHTWNKDFPYSCCICLCCSRYTSKHHGNEHIRRSEEHTSELQSRFDLVCRLLLEKKKTPRKNIALYK